MTACPGRILGIDYGTKRVGVSLSDPMRIISQGVGTLANDAGLLRKLKEIVEKEEVVLVVVGMPYGADGGKGGKAIEVEEFITCLRGEVSVEIDTWDESYSSVNAQRAFIDAGMKRKQRQQKHRVDEMAARLMLQEYLDNQGHRL